MSTGIGIIGLGFMGMTHFEASKLVRNASVVAIATRSEKKLTGDWSDIQGNFGPRGSSQTDLTGIKAYREYQELLSDPDVHLVHVCLPTNQHEAVTLEALASGKHVLVEKPIAIKLDSARRMLAKAESSERLLMVAQVLPFIPEFRWALKAVRDQRFGKLLGASFRRIICPPDWSSEMSDFRALGGAGIDLHIHDNHFINLLCGVPRQVFSRGLLKDGFVNHVSTQYLFDDLDSTVNCVSGGIAAGELKFAHSFELLLERATIQFDAGTYGSEWVVNRPLTLIPNQGPVEFPDLSGSSSWCAAFTDEIQAAVDSVQSRQVAPELSGHLAVKALEVCYAEADSIRCGQPVRIAD